MKRLRWTSNRSKCPGYIVLLLLLMPGFGSVAAQSRSRATKDFDESFRDAYALFRSATGRKAELTADEYQAELTRAAEAFREALTRAVPSYQGQATTRDFDLIRELQDKSEFGEPMTDEEKVILDAATENKKFQQARYLLAFVEMQRERFYDAAILARFVARNFPPQEPLSLDSAYLALAASLQAYHRQPPEDNSVERDNLIQVARDIERNWSESSRANEARLMVARLLHREKKFEQAADWYGRVAESSYPFAEAQMAAGQIYWTMYLQQLQKPVDSRPSAARLEQLLKLTEQHLKQGVTIEQKRLVDEQVDPAQPIEMPNTLVAAQASLAQLLVFTSREAEAIQLLTTDPFSVLNATRMPGDGVRPATGPRSRGFAMEIQRLLLRASIGAGRIPEATGHLAELERLAGPEVTSAVAATYVEIGRTLETELRSTVDNPARQQQVRAAFEAFLQAILDQQQTVNAAVLVWVGQTYQTFAENADEEETRKDYFARARAAYEGIQSESDQTDLSDAQQMSVRLRIVECLRHEHLLDQARTALAALLQKHPRAVELQLEGGLLLDAQAAGSNQVEAYRRAIDGTQADGTDLWGWLRLSRLLATTLDGDQANASMLARYSEVRYRLAAARLALARRLAGADERETELMRARLEIESMIAAGNRPSDAWFDPLDEVYRQILEELGEPTRSLQDLLP